MFKKNVQVWVGKFVPEFIKIETELFDVEELISSDDVEIRKEAEGVPR